MEPIEARILIREIDKDDGQELFKLYVLARAAVEGLHGLSRVKMYLVTDYIDRTNLPIEDVPIPHAEIRITAEDRRLFDDFVQIVLGMLYRYHDSAAVSLTIAAKRGTERAPG